MTPSIIHRIKENTFSKLKIIKRKNVSHIFVAHNSITFHKYTNKLTQIQF